jgi:hypothetical protein
MSKRPAGQPGKTAKRKHVSLSIKDKAELLTRLDKDTLMKLLCDEYGVCFF